MTVTGMEPFFFGNPATNRHKNKEFEGNIGIVRRKITNLRKIKHYGRERKTDGQKGTGGNSGIGVQQPAADAVRIP